MLLEPIGPTGEIGANCYRVSKNSSHFFIDFGAKFPNDDLLQIKYLLPDLNILSRSTTERILFTHAHEDHLGGIRKLKEHHGELELYLSPFSKRQLITREELPENIQLLEYEEFVPLCFENKIVVFPIPVNHSIPDTFAFLICDEEAGTTIFYASDFSNIPATSMDFVIKKFRTASFSAVFSDSTNIFSQKKQITEFEIKDDLKALCTSHTGRIFITCFSSNIDRIKTIQEIALATDRNIIPYGRSVGFNIEVAIKQGLLVEDNFIFDPYPDLDLKENVIVVLSGCQGDFRGTYNRIARNEDPIFHLRENDLLLYSAKYIPGNEKQAVDVLNHYALAGCKVVTSAVANIHASGHINAPNLLAIYRQLAPDLIIPVHGETIFLHHHIELIKQQKLAPQTLTIRNSQGVEFDGTSAKLVDTKSEHPLVSYYGEKEVLFPLEKIKERKKIARRGILLLSIKLDSLPTRNPRFTFSDMGLPDYDQNSLEHVIRAFLTKNKIINSDEFTSSLRSVVRKKLEKQLGEKPEVVIHLV